MCIESSQPRLGLTLIDQRTPAAKKMGEQCFWEGTLAEATGLSRDAVYRAMRGGPIHEYTAHILAAALGVADVDSIFPPEQRSLKGGIPLIPRNGNRSQPSSPMCPDCHIEVPTGTRICDNCGKLVETK